MDQRGIVSSTKGISRLWAGLKTMKVRDSEMSAQMRRLARESMEVMRLGTTVPRDLRRRDFRPRS